MRRTMLARDVEAVINAEPSQIHRSERQTVRKAAAVICQRRFTPIDDSACVITMTLAHSFRSRIQSTLTVLHAKFVKNFCNSQLIILMHKVLPTVSIHNDFVIFCRNRNFFCPGTRGRKLLPTPELRIDNFTTALM